MPCAKSVASWPVKNSQGPARTPWAYWISVPPIGVGEGTEERAELLVHLKAAGGALQGLERAGELRA